MHHTESFFRFMFGSAESAISTYHTSGKCCVWFSAQLDLSAPANGALKFMHGKVRGGLGVRIKAQRNTQSQNALRKPRSDQEIVQWVGTEQRHLAGMVISLQVAHRNNVHRLHSNFAWDLLSHTAHIGASTITMTYSRRRSTKQT